MPASKVSPGKTETAAFAPDDILQRNSALHNLGAGPPVIQSKQIGMAEGVSANLILRCELPDAGRIHHRKDVPLRNVERGRNSILVQKLRQTQIQRMAIIPAGREIGTFAYSAHACVNCELSVVPPEDPHLRSASR
jgi:hypothetical protein